MFKKGILIVLLLTIVATLATCGVLYCQHSQAEPPDISKADTVLEVTKGSGLIRVYLYDKRDRVKDGDSFILNKFYEYDGKRWRYQDRRPLTVTPLWGDVIEKTRR